jgi:hypothetical protein
MEIGVPEGKTGEVIDENYSTDRLGTDSDGGK